MPWNISAKTDEPAAGEVLASIPVADTRFAVWPCILLILFGLFSGSFLMFAYYNGYLADVGLSPRPDPVDFQFASNGLTSPLLECQDDTTEIRPFKDKLETLIAGKKNSGEISFASVYFRDLNNGPWFGIYENEPIKTADSMRMPIAFWYLRQAVYNPEILKQTAVYREDTGSTYHQIHLHEYKHLEFDRIYTVSELLEQMQGRRDMHAAAALKSIYPDFSRRLDTVFRELNIVNSSGDSVSIRNFGSMFRVLFNASYLDKELSEQTLQTLSRSERDGIAAAIPEEITVAHTLGENTFGELIQHHACGIVYYPGNPYLLCTSVRAESVEVLHEVIRDISALVYREVGSQLVK